MAAAKFVGFMTETLEAANMVDVFAKRLNVSTQQVQEFQAIAQTTGLQMNFFQHAFRTLNFQVSQSRPEFAELSKAAGGVKFNFKDTGELFWQVGEALNSVADPTRRAYLAQTLLGRSAQQLMPIFSGTTEEIEAFRKKIQQTSEVYSKGFIDKARKSVAEIGVLDRVWRKFGGLLVEKLLPAFNWIVDRLQVLGQKAQDWVTRGEAMNSMIAGLIVGFGLLVAAVAPLALALAAPAIGIGLLFIAVEDFVGFIKGIDSATGRFFDKIFGEGGADKARDEFKKIGTAVEQFFDLLKNPDKSWGQLVTGLAAASNKIEAVLEGMLDKVIDHFVLYLADKLNDELASHMPKKLAEWLGFSNKNERHALDGITPEGSSSDPDLPSKAQNALDDFSDEGLSRAARQPKSKAERAADEWDPERLRALGAPDQLPPDPAHAAANEWAPTALSDTAKVPTDDGRKIRQALDDFDPQVLHHIANPTPALAPSTTNNTTVNAPVNVENNITVQGSANASTARDIASKTGEATLQSVSGRGLDAIGASVGISQ